MPNFAIRNEQDWCDPGNTDSPPLANAATVPLTAVISAESLSAAVRLYRLRSGNTTTVVYAKDASSSGPFWPCLPDRPFEMMPGPPYIRQAKAMEVRAARMNEDVPLYRVSGIESDSDPDEPERRIAYDCPLEDAEHFKVLFEQHGYSEVNLERVR